ncbi:MAG TPA: helix-turn-helix transcriptional regulator [Usitatibacter sp.]|nr:helix-turn-helix transcriptional regulator [Usitatibacter sp.]
MDLMIDSELIKAERQSRGWSQEQLAAAAGLGVRTIQRMESGSMASSESAKCLAAVFGVPFTRLVIQKPKAFWRRRRLWAAAAAACAAAGSSVFLMSRANATDIGMAIKLGTATTDESRMNVEVNDGGQTEIKLERNIRLLLRPTLQKDGTIFLATEIYVWDGTGFNLVGKPTLRMRQDEETRLKLGLLNGRSARISIVPKEIKTSSPPSIPKAIGG